MRAKIYEWQGKEYTIAELAEMYNKTQRVIYARLRSGWDLTAVLTKPLKTAKTYEYNGKMYTCRELADMRGISQTTMNARLKTMTTKKAMALPMQTNKSHNHKQGMRKPEYCTHPDCDRCPYPDCVA